MDIFLYKTASTSRPKIHITNKQKSVEVSAYYCVVHEHNYSEKALYGIYRIGKHERKLILFYDVNTIGKLIILYYYP